jgi:predicted nucleic acid-binding protein
MRPTLYMETSVVSYLTARPTKDLIMAARQLNTHLWWTEKRRQFGIHISRFVWDEASAGDVEQVRQRLKLLKRLPWLQLTSESALLARALAGNGPLPPQATQDALHIAVAAVHGIHFLATWNLKHINNPAMADDIREVCRAAGFHCPVICTPEELLSVEYERPDY